ncbi:MAG: hypothetical protein IJ262_06365 [Clostridia bacterium]|nr:hypothetical protein [Clostridia bacterium]
MHSVMDIFKFVTGLFELILGVFEDLGIEIPGLPKDEESEETEPVA